MFPFNPEIILNVRQPEKYSVNLARIENYLNNGVPYCQRLSNDDHRQEQERTGVRKEQAEHQGGAKARREG